jgi:ABC-2 type transport system permease protein
MSAVLAHTRYMTARHVRNLARQPWYVAFTLFTPVMYLVLFGQLFKSVAELPGFGTTDYITFLTPGIAVMTAVFSAGWSGMGEYEDLDRGVLDRFLVSPASRTALVAGRLVQVALIAVIQVVIIVGLGLILGADYAGGPVGILLMMLAAVLVAVPIGAFSNAIALLLRQEESIIGVNQFLLLPLTFLSSVFMAPALMPGWIRTVSKFNPLTWAVETARAAVSTSTDWGLVATRLGWLVVLGAVTMWFAVRTFRAYQRSV